MILSNHLILCHPLLLLPSIFHNITVLPNELALSIRWPKCWNLSFSIRNIHSSQWIFKVDFLVWSIAIQGTLKSLLWHHKLKASILWHSAFFMVQLSHPYLWLLEKPWKVWKWSRSVMSNSLWPRELYLLGSSLQGIFQARILEWVAISSSRGASQPRDRTWVSCIAGRYCNL